MPSTPLANELVERDTPADPSEVLFPLDLLMCRLCGHVQLGHIVAPERLFSQYIYASSTSPVTIAHLREQAQAVLDAIADCAFKAPPTVLEVGSNDGAFLKELIKLGFPANMALGVEPSETMAEKAVTSGVPTVKSFFGPGIERLVGRRDWSVIVANNVLAHVPSVRDTLELCEKFLAKDGVLVMEVGAALDVLKGAFDVIYHEHMSYHSLAPLRLALAEVGLRMFDVERFEHEVGRGSLRVWAGRNRRPTERMIQLMVDESISGVGDIEIWNRRLGFNGGEWNHINNTKIAIKEFFEGVGAGREPKPVIAGYGAPAKLTTLTYACDVPDVAVIIEDSPWKIGKLTPGKRIPIVSMKDGLSLQPDAIVAFAWNFAGAIANKLQEAGWHGPVFVPLPKPFVIYIGG